MALSLNKLKRLGDAGLTDLFEADRKLWTSMAKVTTALYLLPIVTGITTIYRPATRRWHRRVAFLVLAMTVLTAITGTTMILMATPIG